MDKKAIYRAFGKAVADRRRRLHMTQADLAERIGLSRGSIAHIERGSQKVFLHQILALADALELDSSHEIIPTRVISSSIEPAPRVKILGARNLSADQRAQIEQVVGLAGEKSQ